MSNVALIEEPELPKTESVTVPIRQNKFTWRKGSKVAGVAILGMRNKPLRLRRMQLERLQTFMEGALGLPQFYALQFDKRIVHVWPYCVRDLHFIIEYGDLHEETEGDQA